MDDRASGTDPGEEAQRRRAEWRGLLLVLFGCGLLALFIVMVLAR